MKRVKDAAKLGHIAPRECDPLFRDDNALSGVPAFAGTTERALFEILNQKLQATNSIEGS
jgi:hypothetical protein